MVDSTEVKKDEASAAGGNAPAKNASKAVESKTPAPARAAGGGGRGRRGDGGGDGGRGGRGGRGGKGGRGRGGRDREKKEPEFKETLVDVYRCSATVKGGRRLSFGAMVAIGDARGKVGIGYGKAKEVPGAIQKAIKKGRQQMVSFPISRGGTIPHQVKGRFGASQVIIVPARPGTGVIAGAAVKAVLEAGGLTNVLTKSVGSNNTRNITKAAIDALKQLRSKERVASLRGVEL